MGCYYGGFRSWQNVIILQGIIINGGYYEKKSVLLLVLSIGSVGLWASEGGAETSESTVSEFCSDMLDRINGTREFNYESSRRLHDRIVDAGTDRVVALEEADDDFLEAESAQVKIDLEACNEEIRKNREGSGSEDDLDNIQEGLESLQRLEKDTIRSLRDLGDIQPGKIDEWKNQQESIYLTLNDVRSRLAQAQYRQRLLTTLNQSLEAYAGWIRVQQSQREEYASTSYARQFYDWAVGNNE